MNTRGLSNIEFIMAFILFIGFVGASIYFFNPVKSTKLIESSLTYTFNEIVKNATTNVDSYSVKLASSSVKQILIERVALDKNVRVEKYDGTPIDSKREGNIIYFDNPSENTFVIIYFNEEFKEKSISVTSTGEYQISSSLSEELISENQILNLNKSYWKEEGYAKLKEELNLPRGLDFSFKLKLNKTEISAEKSIPLNSQMFSKTEIREVLRIDGGREFGYLIVKVW